MDLSLRLSPRRGGLHRDRHQLSLPDATFWCRPDAVGGARRLWGECCPRARPSRDRRGQTHGARRAICSTLIAMPGLDWAKIKLGTLMIGASARNVDWRQASPEMISCDGTDLAAKLIACLPSRHFEAVGGQKAWIETVTAQCRRGLAQLFQFTDGEMAFPDGALDKGVIDASRRALQMRRGQPSRPARRFAGRRRMSRPGRPAGSLIHAMLHKIVVHPRPAAHLLRNDAGAGVGNGILEPRRRAIRQDCVSR